MSHQTGITASNDLRAFFGESKDGSVRVMKISIKDEQLVLDQSAGPIGTWEDDYDKLILPMLEEKQPCYIFYRLDSQSNGGYDWVYISYSPDFSQVRQKMLYAATRATLKKEFGGGQVKYEVFGTNKDDVSLAGYEKHIVAQAAPAPLTYAEEELKEIKKNEVQAEIGVDTKHQTITGVAFPISQQALDALRELQQGSLNYVQLKLDLDQESIELDNCEDTDVANLPNRVPSDHARYHFFNFKHTHEGDYMESIVFIYSMPGYKCSIKERMLYSSCKSPLLDVCEQQLGFQIARKLEIDDKNELSEENIYDEIHPKKNIVKQKFAKPRGPAGRGPKRMTRPKPEESNE